MKILKTLITIATFVATGFMGCKNKTPKELIVKKWKMTEMSGGMTNRMPDSVRQKVLGNTVMEFTNDGKYILTSMDSSSHTGTYSISDDEITLTITPDGTGKPEKNILDELTNNKLVFTDEFGTRLVSVPK